MTRDDEMIRAFSLEYPFSRVYMKAFDFIKSDAKVGHSLKSPNTVVVVTSPSNLARQTQLGVWLDVDQTRSQRSDPEGRGWGGWGGSNKFQTPKAKAAAADFSDADARNSVLSPSVSTYHVSVSCESESSN